MLQANKMANVSLMQETGATLNIVAPNYSLVAILGTLLGGILGVRLVLLRSWDTHCHGGCRSKQPWLSKITD